MFKGNKFKTLRYMLASKRLVLLSISVVCIIVVLILIGKSQSKNRRNILPHWFSAMNARRSGVDITAISWAKRHRPGLHGSKLADEISWEIRQNLSRSEIWLVRQRLSRHKTYVSNYTTCLKKRFKEFEQNLPKKLMRFPPAFNELMMQLHKKCNAEILGGGERCGSKHQKLAGQLYVNKDVLTMDELKKELSTVRLGGLWSPSDCTPKAKLAIVIPFRRREHHLPVLLRQLHPVLQRQKLLYRIFVIEQVDMYPFNRGKLMNVGFVEAKKVFNFDCFVFHDVDLIPEDDRNDYGCPSSPRHLSVAVDKFNYNLPYAGIFGGVEMFTKEHFQMVNGFRNSYWGWGAEDDDLYRRTVKVGLQLTRPSMKHGRYTMIKHQSSETPPDRLDKLGVAENALTSDGLLSLHYKRLSIHENLLYTLVRVNLKMEDDMVY